MFPTNHGLLLLILVWASSLGASGPPSESRAADPGSPRAGAGVDNEGRQSPPSLPHMAAPEAAAAILKTRGTVQAVHPGAIVVKTEAGRQWRILVPRKRATVEYRGTASRRWLNHNMNVQFTALLDSRGRAKNDIQQLAVVSIRSEDGMGLQPQATCRPAADAAKKTASDSHREPRPAARIGARRVLCVPYMVIGRLLGIRKRTMVVIAGPHRIEAPLAENVQIQVKLDDYRLARPGDRIDLLARCIPDRPGTAIAQRLVITAAKPLGTESSAEAEGNRAARPAGSQRQLRATMARGADGS